MPEYQQLILLSEVVSMLHLRQHQNQARYDQGRKVKIYKS